MKRILLTLLALVLCAGTARAQTRATVLDSLEYTAFRYFWDTANPANGLIPDRSPTPAPCSIAANGFGFSAICIGVNRGWITRAEGRDRTLTTLWTYWGGPQNAGPSNVMGYQGLYYHFLDMNTGLRAWTSELSTIDTALLFAGIVHAREFFGSADPGETQIRALADSILWRANWDWSRNGDDGISMQWAPESGFSPSTWVGYNEAMIMYLLAIGSPTHGIPGPAAWARWTSGYVWSGTNIYQPQPYVMFSPLFGHQYSHCWIDYRGIQDAYMLGKGITYFENSRRATLTQKSYARFYAQFNPSLGFSDSLWGWTASDDGQLGYAVHGMPGGPNVNGTIAPTAAFSSYVFAPDSVWSMMRNMYNHFRVYPLWGPYGFTDALNYGSTFPWIDNDYLGIDQGPIVMMIENARHPETVWGRVMQNADIQRGLAGAGFHATIAGVPGSLPPPPELEFSPGPNPFRVRTTLRFALPRESRVRIGLYDLAGREIATLLDERREAGEHAVALDGTALRPGVYHVRMLTDGAALVRRLVRLP